MSFNLNQFTEAILKQDKKLMKEIEYSMGNGQCEECNGHSPNSYWWTETIGHTKTCGVAKIMKKIFKMNPVYKKLNLDRDVGWYVADESIGIIHSIRDSDPDKEKKLNLGEKQRIVPDFSDAAKKLATAIEKELLKIQNNCCSEKDK